MKQLLLFILLSFVGLKMYADNGNSLIRFDLKVTTTQNQTLNVIYLYEHSYGVYGDEALKIFNLTDLSELHPWDSLQVCSSYKQIEITADNSDRSFPVIFIPKEAISTLRKNEVKSIEILSIYCLGENNILGDVSSSNYKDKYCGAVPPAYSVVTSLTEDQVDRLQNVIPYESSTYEIAMSQFLYVYAYEQIDGVEEMIKHRFPDSQTDNFHWREKERKYQNLQRDLTDKGLIVFRVFGQGC